MNARGISEVVDHSNVMHIFILTFPETFPAELHHAGGCNIHRKLIITDLDFFFKTKEIIL